MHLRFSYATATRPTGMVLIPAFVIVAWRERRPAIAYAAGLAAGGGLLCLACIVQFILATLSFCTGTARMASLAWFYWQGWLKMLMQISVGTTNWKHGWIKGYIHCYLG